MHQILGFPTENYLNLSLVKNLTSYHFSILDWNKLDFDTKAVKTKKIFKNKLLNKIRPKKLSYFVFKCNNEVRYITMLRMGLSPLRAHKHKSGFTDTSDPFYLVGETVRNTEH